MNCSEARLLLDAYFDSELDLTASLNVERHLAECSSCSTDLVHLERLRDELGPAIFNRTGPRQLDQMRESIRKRAGVGSDQSRSSWVQPALWAALAAAAVLVVMVPLRRGDSGMDRELVDSHVRSLMASHLVDVPSSDQHTVKPWFQGKVDFAPDVPDLKDKGFELVGGRLDILNGRPTAALVYKHGGHYINLWTARTEASDSGLQFSTTDGYQVVRWTTSGLSRWVVTDMNRTELETFLALYR